MVGQVNAGWRRNHYGMARGPWRDHKGRFGADPLFLDELFGLGDDIVD
jgi:hypothetical protein